MPETLEPWKDLEQQNVSDQVKRAVFQQMEEETANSLPHVLKQLPKQPTVQGMDSPHQTGDHVCYDMLTRGPHYLMTAHFTDVAPNAPVRGIHRHIGAPTLFCVNGKGWEWNDEVTYDFETYDLMIVPPYNRHQHGGDKEIGCEIYVPETGRIHHLLGLMWREQHKLSEKPTFPEGTEPLYDEEGRLKGYKIKKGVLGITEDIEVVLGPEPSRDATFAARRAAGDWKGDVTNTYDRYVKLMHDEADFCREVDHVAKEAVLPWENSRMGKLKWLVSPSTKTAANHMWMYFTEIAPGSRTGKHRHLAEEQVLVLQGSGYDVHDGERWDWEQGDMICVPTMTTHQHFNSTDDKVVLLHSVPSIYWAHDIGGIEHFEDAPEYEGD
jgi:quercetin dioxygenase-like cupin family protein